MPVFGTVSQKKSSLWNKQAWVHTNYWAQCRGYWIKLNDLWYAGDQTSVPSGLKLCESLNFCVFHHSPPQFSKQCRGFSHTSSINFNSLKHRSPIHFTYATKTISDGNEKSWQMCFLYYPILGMISLWLCPSLSSLLFHLHKHSLKLQLSLI